MWNHTICYYFEQLLLPFCIIPTVLCLAHTSAWFLSICMLPLNTVTKINQERTYQDRTKIGLSFLRFSPTFFNIFTSKSKKGQILVLSWLFLSCLIFVTVILTEFIWRKLQSGSWDILLHFIMANVILLSRVTVHYNCSLSWWIAFLNVSYQILICQKVSHLLF